MCLKIKKPSECNEDEINTFLHMVEKGEEVITTGLSDRIERAKLLVFHYESNVLVGVAALKQPYRNYIEGVFRKASVSEETNNYSLEIGWAYTEPDYRGKHICSNMIAKLISKIPPRNIFATTKTVNVPMQKILERNGFQKNGNSFPGRTGKYHLQLFVLQKSPGHKK